MRLKPSLALLTALSFAPLTAWAGPTFNFSFTGISGPGSTLSLSLPEPAPVPDYHGPIDVPYGLTPVTVDGVTGYSGTIVLWYAATDSPEIDLDITPDIPDPPPDPPFGQPSGETHISLYDFVPVLSLVSQLPALPPGGSLIDTFQIDPGTYSLSLPESSSATIGLTVTPEASAVPEPSTLLLLGPALLGVAAMVRRQRCI